MIIQDIPLSISLHTNMRHYRNLKNSKCSWKIVQVNNFVHFAATMEENDFNEYCKQMGIQHQSSNPYMSQQNGKAERLNKTTLNSTRAFLIHSKLLLSFWAEKINCASYIYNCSPCAAIEKKTPYELWYGHEADISHICVFGCVFFVHKFRNKLSNKAEKYIFVGYLEGTKGYKFIISTQGNLYEAEMLFFSKMIL